MHVRGLVEGLDRRRKRTGARSKNTNLTRAAGCPKSKWTGSRALFLEPEVNQTPICENDK